MIGNLVMVGLVAGAVSVWHDGGAAGAAVPGLQQCVRAVERACADGDGICLALGLRACHAVAGDGEAARAAAGANLRRRILEVGAACAPAAGGACDLRRDRGRRKREIRQESEPASSLFITRP